MKELFRNNPTYLQLVHLLIKLHLLMKDDNGESKAAYLIRDEMTSLWPTIDEEEDIRLRGMSADLYSLEPESPLKHSEDCNHLGRISSQLEESRRLKNWTNALALMREFPSEIGLTRATLLRGIAYDELGEREVARLFLVEAAKSDLGKYGYSAAHRLQQAGYQSDAGDIWQAMISNASKLSVEAILGCGDYLLGQLQSRSSMVDVEDVAKLFQLAIHHIDAKGSATAYRRFLELAYHGILSCCLITNNDSEALNVVDKLIEINPIDGDYFAFRGLFIQHRDKRQALEAFRRAVELHSVVEWAYFYVARDHLENSRYHECLVACDAALRLTSDADLIARMYEWMAIASAEMEQPAKVVLELFDNAIAFSPNDDSPRQNRALYLGLKKGPNSNPATWNRYTGPEYQPSFYIDRVYHDRVRNQLDPIAA